MESKKFAFTKRKIETIKPPKTGRIYYQDAGGESLNICITAADTRTFYCVKWFQGRKVRVPLGKFPGMSVEEARNACRALVTKMSHGTDVQAARQAARHEQTIGGLWQFWLADAKSRKKASSIFEDERLYELFLAAWANRKLSAIKKTDVNALHAKIGKENGYYRANRLLSLIGAMFTKAADMGYEGQNPARGVKKFKEQKRDRFLTADELPKFFTALAAEPNELFRHFFLLCLLCGARKSNVQAMGWADIDMDRAYWRIPETKSGMPVIVPLVPAAVEILRQRREASNGSPWVFAAHSASGHLSEPAVAWRRLLKRAGLEGLRIHDLRRSNGSWQAIGGSSLSVIGKSLGHTQPSTTAIYARLSMDPVRQSVEAATTEIMRVGKVSVGAGGMVLDVSSVEGNSDA